MKPIDECIRLSAPLLIRDPSVPKIATVVGAPRAGARITKALLR